MFMTLDLTDEEAASLLSLLKRAIDDVSVVTEFGCCATSGRSFLVRRRNRRRQDRRRTEERTPGRTPRAGQPRR
jgi:hypothetical protein